MSVRPVQCDPLYRQGFDDALDGFTLDRDEAPAYVAGWCAAYDCKALLEEIENVPPARRRWGKPGSVRAEYEAWKAKP